MSTDRETLKKSLSAVDYPVSKEEIVDYAENNGFDEGSIRALRALPRGNYENVTEVFRSVPLEKGTEEHQSDSDKAQQARRPQSGVAEHQRQTPVNPIVEELGENRGS